MPLIISAPASRQGSLQILVKTRFLLGGIRHSLLQINLSSWSFRYPFAFRGATGTQEGEDRSLRFPQEPNRDEMGELRGARFVM
jgi:hypothetical protein